MYKKRILIVDDETDFVHFLASNLAHNEFDTSSAHDGDEGFLKACKEKPDLILLDLFMPKTDGFGFLRQLRTDAGTRHIPVMILSAWSSEELAAITRRFGVAGYMAKPCQITDVIENIKGMLFGQQEDTA